MKSLPNKFMLVGAAFAFGILVASFSHNNTTQKASLFDAIKNKSVSFNATSNGKHSGYSVLFALENKTNSPMEIMVPAGTKYLPEDPGEQTLIQLEDQLIVLQPNATFNGKAAAFCTEASDRCPTSNRSMQLARNTDPTMNKMIAFMKGKTLSKGSYQDAVWAISDHHSVANIVTETKDDKEFRQFVADLTGQKNAWYTSPQRVEIDDAGNFNRETVKISGRLEFNCAAGTRVHQDIYKANGEPFYVSDKTMTAKYGNVGYSFNLSVLGWEKGGYYIKIHDGTNELARYDFTI